MKMTKDLKVKPIIFKTEMVEAILSGRKTVTRRVIKPQPMYSKQSGIAYKGRSYGTNLPPTIEGALYNLKSAAPYQKDDILYVRETWAPLFPDKDSEEIVGYMYKADALDGYDSRYPDGKDYQWEGKWRPSIYMPKAAARIWLRVTDVRAERLQDISIEDIQQEGLESTAVHAGDSDTSRTEFQELWDFTLKKKDLERYGWDANPYVWVITFERYEPIAVEKDDEQRDNDKKMFKLRIYHEYGPDKGNLKNEEYFENIQDMSRRYYELFKIVPYNLRPTAWKKKGSDWVRIRGY